MDKNKIQLNIKDNKYVFKMSVSHFNVDVLCL